MSSQSVLRRHIQDFQKLLKLPAAARSVHRYLPKTNVLIVSPHPDDEVLMGALALRLQLANKLKVINVAVTLGSNPKRQAERKRELIKATRLLKWKNVVLKNDWKQKEQELVKLIAKYKPALIIAPHALDRHPTHEATAKLVKAAVKNASTTIAWAEYWNPMQKPNLLVEVSPEIILQQVAALECHAGEVARNPYQLRLLGWQMDSVRRGSEWLANKGAQAAPMLAGQLYRLEKWHNGRVQKSHVDPFAPLSSDLTDWLL